MGGLAKCYTQALEIESLSCDYVNVSINSTTNSYKSVVRKCGYDERTVKRTHHTVKDSMKYYS